MKCLFDAHNAFAVRLYPCTVWASASILVLSLTSCGSRKYPPVEAALIAPDQNLNFDSLYASNCAGCHGENGQNGKVPGAAIKLADPVYLAIATDETIRRVTSAGVPGTPMPAFAQQSGGFLTDRQIQTIVQGIRHWANPGPLGGANPPPYSAESPGDVQRGASAYGTYCSSCHGPDGRGGRASSIVDGSYLALVSDQYLRAIIICGRPDLGAPDWRGDVPGMPMPAQDVSDVVAWLAAKRPQFPGQPYVSGLQKDGGTR
jgi:cytochrome c oxidase cbb3-type subunit III